MKAKKFNQRMNELKTVVRNSDMVSADKADKYFKAIDEAIERGSCEKLEKDIKKLKEKKKKLEAEVDALKEECSREYSEPDSDPDFEEEEEEELEY